jgi:hypothetical protein
MKLWFERRHVNAGEIRTVTAGSASRVAVVLRKRLLRTGGGQRVAANQFT